MNCSNCQREIAEYSNFCYYCGARQQAASPRSPTAGKRLMRSATNKKVAGVCGGFAEYFEVDPTVVRLVWAVLAFVPPLCIAAILGYIIAWIVMPVAPLPAPAQAGASQAAQTS